MVQLNEPFWKCPVQASQNNRKMPWKCDILSSGWVSSLQYAWAVRHAGWPAKPLAETFSKQDEMPAYDERTGEELPPEKVQAGRGRELDKMTEHNVKVDITWQKARGLGLKIVNSRWADGWKHLPNDPKGVRSRWVAQETYQGDDVYRGHRRWSVIGWFFPQLQLRAWTTYSKAFSQIRHIGCILSREKHWRHRLSSLEPTYMTASMCGNSSRQWMAQGSIKTVFSTRWVCRGHQRGLPSCEECLRAILPARVAWCHGDDFLVEATASDLAKPDALMVESGGEFWHKSTAEDWAAGRRRRNWLRWTPPSHHQVVWWTWCRVHMRQIPNMPRTL